MSEMHIQDFSAEQFGRLSRFIRWWYEQNEHDPEGFPLKMQSGDWDEHLSMFDDFDEAKS